MGIFTSSLVCECSSGFCGWSKELPGGRSWAVGKAGELWQVPLLVSLTRKGKD